MGRFLEDQRKNLPQPVKQLRLPPPCFGRLVGIKQEERDLSQDFCPVVHQDCSLNCEEDPDLVLFVLCQAGSELSAGKESIKWTRPSGQLTVSAAAAAENNFSEEKLFF